MPLTGFATAVIQQPDGKILVAGESNGHFSLTRVTAPGALDTSFGVRGSVITTFGGNEDRPNAISLLPDGRILLAGMSQTASSTRTALARYLPNGMPDSTFGVGGVKLITSGPAAGGQGGQGVRGASAVAILPSGQIEIAGTTGTSTKQDWFIARLNSTGAIDPTFGAAGVTVTDFGGGDDVAAGLALTSDGRAVVVGSASVGGIGYSALAFYTSGGALDTSRGDAGKVLTNFGMNNHLTVLDAAAAVSLQADGRIVVAGTLLRADNFGNSIAAWTLARYTPAGALDMPFGTALIGIRDASQGTGGLGAYDTTSVSGLALQADGKIVLAGTDTFGGPGYSEGEIIVSRFIGGPTYTYLPRVFEALDALTAQAVAS